MNGTFTFSTDRAFNAADPRTYPERLSIRVPIASDILLPNHVAVFFAQDQWRRQNLTLNMGVRYDVEMTPVNNANNPFFAPGEHSVDKNNLAPRLGFTWNPGGNSIGVAGRIWDLLRQGHAPGSTPFLAAGVYSPSFVTNYPNDRADPGPSAGRLPTDPMLVGGPTVNRALLSTLVPPGTSARNTGIVNLDNPDRTVPKTHQVTIGYKRQLARQMAVNIDYVHSWNRDQLMRYDLNPGLRVDTSRTRRIVYTDS